MVTFKIRISHGYRCNEIFNRDQNISWLQISKYLRYHEIFHPDQNISWLQISWDISSRSKYLMVENIMRWLIKIKISHSYRYQEIFHADQNISWLLTSWDISSKYIMVIDQFNQSIKTVVNRFRLAHHRTALRDFCWWFP